MKYRNILPFVALSALVLTSCDDNKMEWYQDPAHGAITSSELPLQLAEKISRYEPLKAYLSDPNFKLGIGVGMDEYLGDETTTTIVNENFNDLTIGYAMKHAPMVDSKGNLKFDKVDQLFAKTTEAGVSIYGHCLIWHSNQNASYLNNLIAPEVIPGPAGANLFQNGDFEGNTISPWGAWGTGKAQISEEGDGCGSNYSMKLICSADGGVDNAYTAQAGYSFNTPLEVGKTYEFSAMVKASVSTTFQIQIQNSSTYAGECYVDGNVNTTWAEFKKEFTVNKEDMNRLCINFGVSAGDYYFDNIILSEKVVEARTIIRASGPTIIEKTDEEKEEIIKEAMKSWISQMVTHCKNNVHAWDVVNEPMDDGKPSSIKSGKNKTDLASDEFYWQDYFSTPKDYAVEAFKLTRLYGNADDKLFINDYNLEYSLAKCDGLIEYVKYIESKGATVDGIGTQMHIAIDSNKDNIAQMFQKLAATGKLIKVSELDIKVNTSSPTTENLAQQAEMYQYVIDMYKKYIPLNQQYGITIWGVSDNEKEHVNWIPDDAPNLWDANYARKHAYKGVADGLAGKDVSEGFTGDLQ